MNFYVIPVVQEYLNEIAPNIYGPKKLKTSGKPLRIADKQTPASGQDNLATLYMLKKIALLFRYSKTFNIQIKQNKKQKLYTSDFIMITFFLLFIFKILDKSEINRKSFCSVWQQWPFISAAATARVRWCGHCHGSLVTATSS